MQDRSRVTRLRFGTLIALVVAAAAVAVAAGNALAAPSHARRAAKPSGPTASVAVNRELARVKKALDRYQDVKVAEAAGYKPASPCEMTPVDPGASWWAGAMGVHFVNAALMKPGPLNPMKPPILTYLPTANGGFELLAAEYFQPDADQNLKTDDDRPTLFRRAFDGPMLGHNPQMPIHYDLHVWLWKANPSGVFAPWNPGITCK